MHSVQTADYRRLFLSCILAMVSRALRLVKALASLSPALLYANVEALVSVRHRHPVTHVHNAMAEVVVRAAQMLEA